MKNSKLAFTWIARILGFLALLFFGMFIFAEGVPTVLEEKDPQLNTMLFLMAFAAFAWFFAWFKPKEGGIALTLAGFLLGMNMLYYGGIDDVKAAMIYALPFLIPGVLFWWTGRKD